MEEAQAAVLKDEGAAAFAQKDFDAAAAKYEEALRLVQPSAVQQEASRFAAEAGGGGTAVEADDDDEWSQFNPDLAGNDAAAEAMALAAGRAAESRAALALACALNASLCHARLDPPAWGASAAHAATALALLPPPPPPPLSPQVGDASEGGGGSDSSGSGAPSAAAAAAAAARAASKCKALYRRGKARLELGELAGAKDDLVGAYALDEGSKDVRRALKALKAAREAEAGRAAERAARMACGFGRLGTAGVS